MSKVEARNPKLLRQKKLPILLYAITKVMRAHFAGAGLEIHRLFNYPQLVRVCVRLLQLLILCPVPFAAASRWRMMMEKSGLRMSEDEEDKGDDLEDGVGQDASIGDVLGDDLKLPSIDDEENGDLDDDDDDDDDDDAVEVEENEDEILDDYQDFGLENILNV
ncbi:hypothetical protein P8452_12858 [Trifolium repens]|nr:hypothetical protein P8452_12858 [Trifolium repens]